LRESGIEKTIFRPPGPESSEGRSPLELPEKPKRSFSATPSRSFGDPTLSDLTSRQAVLDAIAEFDRLGREAFLEKSGYGPARRCFLEYDGRLYGSKAIVGVAYGYQYHDHGSLRPGPCHTPPLS
jgi:hypothetical protein